MAGPFDFTGQDIENTYQRVLQTDGTSIYDGTGSIVNISNTIFPFTGSAIITGSLVITGSLGVVGSFNQASASLASGLFAHAQGFNVTASGDYSHAEGLNTKALGIYSHAEGIETTAEGLYSHAEGSSTTAEGAFSHAEGDRTTATGAGSHAEGSRTTATREGSHAEGFDTIAAGDVSHAEGSRTTSTGFASHAEGESTQAIGSFSHAEGSRTTATGFASHAEGLFTVASGSYQHVQGQYNLSSSAQSAFIIGNGTSTSARSNLIFASGSQVQVTGSLQVSGYHQYFTNATQREELSNNLYAFTGQAENYTGAIDDACVEGQLVWLDTNNRWFPVDQTTAASTKLLGLWNGDNMILLEGTMVVDTIQSPTPGLPVYIRDGTPDGVMSTNIPTTVGGYVRVVGHCLYENVATPGQWIIRFKPSNDWYEI